MSRPPGRGSALKNRKQLKTIVFDFDGVILESVDIKTRAFADIYRGYGEGVVQKVTRYHEAHGGIARFEKFKYFHKEFLGVDLSREEIESLALQFRERVFQRMLEAHFVPGAFEFLREHSGDYDCYISSGTPEEEMREIARLRGLDKFFIGIFGSPASKSEHLERIMKGRGYRPAEVVFVGDSGSDKIAAMNAGVTFIARVNGLSELKHELHVMPDLRNLGKYLEENLGD